jgi:hypothetical protein
LQGDGSPVADLAQDSNPASAGTSLQGNNLFSMETALGKRGFLLEASLCLSVRLVLERIFYGKFADEAFPCR